MKNICRIVVALCIFVFGLGAEETNAKKIYLSVKAGASLMEFSNSSYNSTTLGNWDAEYDRSARDTVGIGALAIGYYITPQIRTELEYAYRKEHTYTKTPTNNNMANSKQKTAIQTVMANVAYDFDALEGITPFIFGGIGIAHHEFDFYAKTIPPLHTYGGKKKTTSLAANVGFGASYPLGSSTVIDFSYRFSWLGEGKWQALRSDDADKGYGSADFSASEILLGIRYVF